MKIRKPADKSRMQYRRWTPAEITYLKRNYRRIGDKELAQRLTDKISTDGKVWQLKQIEKKRSYLGLHRTPEELDKIKGRNTAAGCWSINHWKRWINQKPVGHVIQWLTECKKPVLYIKTDKGYKKLSRQVWEQAHGKIPKRSMIRHKDGNQLNCELGNLECVTREEHGRRNAMTDGRMAWELAAKNPDLKAELLKHPELLELKRTLKKLNTEIRHARD